MRWKMGKVILSADSTCDLTPELLEKYGVTCYPYHIVLDGQDYQDNVDITPEEIFKTYYDKKLLPQTAAINSYEYEDYFRKWTDRGDTVIHFNLGAALSASHRNCLAAAAELGNIYAVDSYNLSTGMGLLVIKAAELLEQGMDAAEVVERVKQMRSKVKASFVLDTLRFMHAGGRCSGVTAFSANMLNIKPCIEVDNTSGGMGVGKKYRGSMQKVLIKYVKDILADVDALDLSRVFITYSSLEDMKYIDILKKTILEIAPFKEVHITKACCTISCHCGPNTLGVLFMTK